VQPAILGPALLEQLDRPDRAALVEEFGRIHRALRRNASMRAADAVLELLAGRRALR
jgi:hypothetical protein